MQTIPTENLPADPARPEIRILIPAEAIASRLASLVDEICAGAPDRNLVLVGLLRGSFMFISDLARVFYSRQTAVEIDFMGFSSYEGTRSSGYVTLLKDVSIDLAGRDVLLVDDILDTGLTISKAFCMLKERPLKSLKTCVLLEKKERRKVDFTADYVGFQIPDRFVVGYGLDYNNRYRELPYVGLMEPA